MTITANMMRKALGQVGTFRPWNDGFSIQVRVMDVRSSYGKAQFQVEPLAGSGLVWVMADRVLFATADTTAIA